MPPLLSTLFGGALTLAAAYGTGSFLLCRIEAPPEIRLAVGACTQSLLIFLLLLGHAAIWPVLLALGLAGAALARWGRPSSSTDLPWPGTVAALLFAAYGLFYLVNGLAPEIQPDAISYHLGLTYEYARFGAFPDHIRFYDLIPQGMEMLFTMAFVFGRHAAAKLVELGMYTAGVPLIFRIGGRLGLNPTGSLVVAVFYWTAPVFGLTGASTYNDAGQVFFTLGAFYLLLLWRDTGDSRYLLPAGALAGFCYAIKMPGAFTTVAALLFLLSAGKRRQWRDFLPFAMGLALTAAPWVVRSAVLTGNPVAPLGDALFPNPYFHLRSEREMSATLSGLHGIPPFTVPWQLAFGDGFTGTFGPLLLLLPLGVFAARRREGRICLVAAVILAIPWWNNTGARFLMPGALLCAFALAMVLPRRAAWAAVALQSLVCCPPLLNAWQPPYTFRLHELPWKAAAGIESEQHYLQAHVAEYDVARMVEHYTPPGASTFALMPVAAAYVARDISVAWQSAEGDCLTETLRLAARYHEDPLFNWTSSWAPGSVKALRFRLPEGFPGEWDIDEVQLFSGPDRIFNSPSWSLRAWPNVWEAPLAFDTRRSTVWRTWQPARRGMFLELDLDHPQALTSAAIVAHSAGFGIALEIYGQQAAGSKWRLLSGTPVVSARSPEDLRLEATGVLRRAGFRYLLAPVNDSGFGPLGRRILAEAPYWGMEKIADAGANVLFKLH